VLNFGHQELSNPQKAAPGRDFVSIGFTNAGRRERHGALIIVEQLLEVEELALGGFGAEVDWGSSTRAHGGFEHQVEGDRREDLIVRIRIPDVVNLDQFGKAIAVVVVDLSHEAVNALKGQKLAPARGETHLGENVFVLGSGWLI
jgi:hypothetical protein